jgi:uroporphyrin-III C-methyltransferase / precorrin-2 dehydrogenase / sirohydrochlorin ferrochelatase
VNFNHTPCEAQPGRIGPLATLPVFLVLGGRRAVIAGGSAAAAWKAELLSAAGACVDVYAEEISIELRGVSVDPPGGTIAVHECAWTADDLKGAAVAVGAFADEADAARFAQMARTAGVPVNVIDRPAFCDFTFGAIVNRSPLVIGISTDGAAPVFAQAIRAKLEALLPRRFAAWAAAAQSWRAAVKASGLSHAARRNFWQRFTAHAMRHTDGEPSQADFDGLLAEAKGQGAAAENGSITVVDTGSGDDNLLTLRAVRALQTADVIVYDAGVSHAVLDFARREARKLPAVAGQSHAVTALAANLVRQGKRVVRLTSRRAAAVGAASKEIASIRSLAN